MSPQASQALSELRKHVVKEGFQAQGKANKAVHHETHCENESELEVGLDRVEERGGDRRDGEKVQRGGGEKSGGESDEERGGGNGDGQKEDGADERAVERRHKKELQVRWHIRSMQKFGPLRKRSNKCFWS